VYLRHENDSDAFEHLGGDVGAVLGDLDRHVAEGQGDLRWAFDFPDDDQVFQDEVSTVSIVTLGKRKSLLVTVQF
jgi:hypothetical protein